MSFQPSKDQLDALIVLRAALSLCEAAKIRIETDLDHISIDIGHYPNDETLHVTTVSSAVINDYLKQYGAGL